MAMGRPKGYPKSGGRPPGTPNKLTSFKNRLEALCEEMGIDPFRSLLEYTSDVESKTELRFAALKEACQYLYPKLKAIEHSGEIRNPYAETSDKELEEIVRKILSAKRSKTGD